MPAVVTSLHVDAILVTGAIKEITLDNGVVFTLKDQDWTMKDSKGSGPVYREAVAHLIIARATK
jgi:hypothetical protein